MYIAKEVRIVVFADGLSSCFKTPCVVFTGHPSLRYGDVVHFMELWGKSSGNTVIFTGKLSCYRSRPPWDPTSNIPMTDMSQTHGPNHAGRLAV